MFADYTCNSCSVSVKTLKGYVQHQGLHRNEAHYLYAGCKSRFRNYNAFKCHVYRHHRQSSSASQCESLQGPFNVKLPTVGDSWSIFQIFWVTSNFTFQKESRCIAPSKTVIAHFQWNHLSHLTYLESTNTLQLRMSSRSSFSSLLLKDTQMKGQMMMGWGGYTRPCTNEELIYEKSVHVLHEVAGEAPDPFLHSTVNHRRD